MSESSTSMSWRRRYEASPTSRNSSTSISSRSIRAAARIAFDGGANDLRIVFSDGCTFGGAIAMAGSSPQSKRATTRSVTRMKSPRRGPRRFWPGVPSIGDFPYVGSRARPARGDQLRTSNPPSAVSKKSTPRNGCRRRSSSTRFEIRPSQNGYDSPVPTSGFRRDSWGTGLALIPRRARRRFSVSKSPCGGRRRSDVRGGALRSQSGAGASRRVPLQRPVDLPCPWALAPSYHRVGELRLSPLSAGLPRGGKVVFPAYGRAPWWLHSGHAVRCRLVLSGLQGRRRRLGRRTSA